MENLALEEQATLFVNGIYAIDKLYGEYAKSVGLTYLGLSVLNAIYEQDGSFTQKALSEQAGLPKQSVNVVIRSLWEQGYIEMKELDSDRRNKEIWLSETGRAYVEQVAGTMIAAVANALGERSYQQRQDIIDLLTQIAASYSAIIQGDAPNTASEVNRHAKS